MISNCGSDERGKATGGATGDNNGREWRVRSWYSYPWNCVLRHPDASVRALIAEMAEQAAKNDCIGYDQYQRLTFWEQLKKVGYRPERITVKCESDCSAGVAAIVKGAGYRLGNEKLQAVNTGTYTGNLRARLKAAGFEVLTASKYLTSDKYLLAGDVLLKEGRHTAINLTDGSGKEQSTVKDAETVNITLKVLRKGAKGAQVEALQNLLVCAGYELGKVDGDYGSKTKAAVEEFQKAKGIAVDGVAGAATWRKLLGA